MSDFKLVKLIDGITVQTTVVPKGAYDNGVTYLAGEAVSYTDGSSYVALQTTQGNLPTDTTYWMVLAQGAGDGTFLGLSDTPAAYTGQSLKLVRVNVGETALEFGDAGAVLGDVVGLLDETAHDLLDHTGLTGIPDITGLLDETAHDLLDHTGIAAAPPAWGNITGTLSSQTDLQAVLDSKGLKHGFVSMPAAPSFTGNVYTLPGSTPYSVYIGGVLSSINASKTIDISALAEWSVTMADNYGQWFIYMLANGTLGASQTPWDILDETVIPVDTAYGNDDGAGGIEWIIAKEKHAAKRNLLMHKQEHDTDGARWVSGLNTLTVGTGAGGNSTNTFSLAGGVIRDEDIYHTIANPQTQCRIGYRNGGANNPLKFDAAGTTYAKLNAGAPQYDNAGTLTTLSVSSYGVIWQYATNRIATPIVHILGQGQYASVAAAQAAAQPSLPGLSAAEWKLVNRIIIRNVAGALNWIQTDALYQTTTGPAVGGGGISTLPAGNITFTPSGNIAATNVQAAIEELDSEKQAASADLTDLATAWTPASASAAASLDFAEDTDNGTHKVTVTAPAALATDVTVTLPSATGTVATLAGTEKFENKELADYKEEWYAATTSGNVTIDLANGMVQRFILDAARQFTMPSDPGAYGKSFVLIIECATYTPIWNSSPTIEWLTSDGAAPTLVTTANLVNVLTFMWDDVDSRWLGFLAGKETA